MSIPRPTPLALATVSLLVVVSLGLWGWSIDPGRPGRWAFIVFFLPSLWGYVELAQFRGNDRAVAQALMNFHRCSIAWGASLLAVSVALKLALTTGALGPEWVPFGRRITGVILGFGLAVFGNYLPKLLSPWSVSDQPFNWQRVHRFAGWVFMLGGITIVTIWMVLPVDGARFLSRRVLLVALVLVVGRKMISLATHPSGAPAVQ